MNKLKQTKPLLIFVTLLLIIIGCSTVNINRKTTNHVEIKTKGRTEISISKGDVGYLIKYRDASYEHVENYYVFQLSKEEFHKLRNVLLNAKVTDDFVEHQIGNKQFLIKQPKRDNIKILISSGNSQFRRIDFKSNKKMKQILNKIEL